ncbi:MAG: hypothetical protein ACRETL_08505, partial [Gammaproteobacteria bacterium]
MNSDIAGPLRCDLPRPRGRDGAAVEGHWRLEIQRRQMNNGRLRFMSSMWSNHGQKMVIGVPQAYT